MDETPHSTPEAPIQEQKISPPENLAVQLYKDMVASLTEPRQFFTERYPKVSFSYALAFAVVVNWTADFLQWLTRIVRHETLLDGLLKMRHQLEALPLWKDLPSSIWAQVPDHNPLFPAWIADFFGVALSPFHTLIRIIMSGLILWMGAWMLIPKDSSRDDTQLSQVVKLAALSSAPNLIGAILGFLPLNLGSFFSWIYGIVLMVFAITIRYRVSNLRAFGVMVIPGFLLSVVGTCIVGLFAGLLFGALAALFGFST